ncbi:MAG TPA: response regulator [Thermomicrobiaceae bacterium]|nr:response regulator [Thermomicrobiaceae bacterium]
MLRVLVVDDDSAVLRVLADALSLAGYVVREATDGADALATARTWQPDVLVTDLSMPGIDGVEAIRQLRQDPATRAIRIVVCSGTVDRVEQERLAVDAIVAKPFDLEVLVAAVAGQAEPPRDVEPFPSV